LITTLSSAKHTSIFST